MKTLEEYRKQGFNEEQLDQICKGLENGLNVSVYAKECFDWL